MTKYLAGVLSVIAVGILLIAYGLLVPRGNWANGAGPMAPGVRTSMMVGAPDGASEGYSSSGYGGYMVVPVGSQGAYPMMVAQGARSRVAQTVSYQPDQPVRRRTSTYRTVDRNPRRDWKRTALIVGGSSATGAGVGAIFGGKKGALIGAAIAGGVSTIVQTVK